LLAHINFPGAIFVPLVKKLISTIACPKLTVMRSATSKNLVCAFARMRAEDCESLEKVLG